MAEGAHKGVEPKSDRDESDPLYAAVYDALTDEPWLDATDIELSVSGSTVTLTGTVPTNDGKARAEKTAMEVEGVTEVKNELIINIHEGNSGVAEMNRIRSITDGDG